MGDEVSVAAFKIEFSGALSERNLIGAYDAAAALRGFERSLALTTHAVLNGDIIVQAPALKGAVILFEPPEQGSWTTRALVVIGGIWALNNADQHTPIGHLLYSAYDYVINSATGGDLDYDKPIRRIIEEQRNAAPEASNQLSVDVLDGVVERAEKSIEEIHWPIVETETASNCKISYRDRTDGILLDRSTFEYISQSVERPRPEKYSGAISSYNMNSFTGRVFLSSLGRTVAFLLSDTIRNARHVDRITASLRANALKLGNETFDFEAIVVETPSGRIRRLVIFNF
jgi:hypothetical protein